MRAKTNTASTCWHTSLCAATFLKETLEIRRNLTGGIPRSPRGSGEEERARKDLKNCFGQVEETFRPSQVVFLRPHDPDTLIIDGF
jgi:hypothetical protein